MTELAEAPKIALDVLNVFCRTLAKVLPSLSLLLLNSTKYNVIALHILCYLP